MDVKKSYSLTFCLKQDQPCIMIMIITFMTPNIPLDKQKQPSLSFSKLLMLCLVSKYWRIHNLDTPPLTSSMGT